MTKFFQIATQRPIIQRAVVMSVIVGPTLIVINQGGRILSGDCSWDCLLRSLLTVIVPYCVSTVSSVLTELKSDA